MLALLIPGVGMGGGLAGAPVFSGPIPDISVTENTGTHSYDLSAYFTLATSYSIAPAVETGWTFDTNTGELVIDTDALGTFGGFTVTGTNLAGSADSNSFTVTVSAAEVAVQPQGGSAKRRKRYFFELDGEYFEVDSQAEAEAKLRQALTLAQEVVAPRATERSAKRIRRGKGADAPKAPTLTSSPELASVVDEYRDRINAVYRQIAVDAELRELLRIKLIEQDEDEAITALLLH